MIAYDYQELIDELKDEVGDGILQKSEIIQVLRANKAIEGEYFPIIDWHYKQSTMAVDLAKDNTDTKEEVAIKKVITDQYHQDQPSLKDMTVEACLAEMFERTNA